MISPACHTSKTSWTPRGYGIYPPLRRRPARYIAGTPPAAVSCARSRLFRMHVEFDADHSRRLDIVEAFFVALDYDAVFENRTSSRVKISSPTVIRIHPCPRPSRRSGTSNPIYRSLWRWPVSWVGSLTSCPLHFSYRVEHLSLLLDHLKSRDGRSTCILGLLEARATPPTYFQLPAAGL